MNAKEMFEELGYELIGNCGGLTYSKEKKLLGRFVVRFENSYKTIFSNWTHKNIVNKDILPQRNIISLKLHQAIHQQMIELGWIEE